MAGLAATEMFYEAKIIYESIASTTSPGFNPREWSVLLTQAQEKVVLDIYSDGTERNEPNRKALYPLLKFVEKTSGDIDTNSSYPNAYEVNLGNSLLNDYLYTLNERADITGFTDIEVKPISRDYWNANRFNPFKNPYEWMCWRLGEYHGAGTPLDIRPIIITDGKTLTKYKLDYLKKPDPIIIPNASYPNNTNSIEGFVLYTYRTTGLDCQLDQSIHRRIVEKAAKLATTYMKDQALQQMQIIEDKQDV